MSNMIEIHYRQLVPETLLNLLGEIALREGTNYGEVEFTLEEKVMQLRNALESGKAVIVFDAVND